MTTCPTRAIKDDPSPAPNKVIELLSVGKQYPQTTFSGLWALKDVSLDVYQGQILGVIGRNGAGKTTLLNIIAAVLSPTEGKLNIKGKTFGLFNLGVGFQDELTGRENIFLNGAIIGSGRKELENKLASIIEFSELGNFIDMPLGTYSAGMRLRLGFSIIANLDFDILVIDEVLAVGDMLFQSKCFQRLMDFKRQKRTLVITSQSMELIERLSDGVLLLDHGKALFCGDTVSGINRYRKLLDTENFFVGPAQKEIKVFENTKKWAEDESCWGNVLGTQEASIDRVELRNKFGRNCSQIKSRDPLGIKVYFNAKDNIKEPHFGAAIFRKDRVYCYGPNSAFDGIKIPELKKGKGYFALNFRKVLLSPGEYRISVAVWDKNETLPFSYHNGFYELVIRGNNQDNRLLNLPFKVSGTRYLSFKKIKPDLSKLNDRWGKIQEGAEFKVDSVKFYDRFDKEKNIFLTNECFKIEIRFDKIISNNNKDCYLWVGFYRDDGIYCQGITEPLNKKRLLRIIFPELALLPGKYLISFGIWDSRQEKFLLLHHAAYPLKMVFTKPDHGTLYLKHSWNWGKIKS